MTNNGPVIFYSDGKKINHLRLIPYEDRINNYLKNGMIKEA